jgi:hypothetical protein
MKRVAPLSRRFCASTLRPLLVLLAMVFFPLAAHAVTFTVNTVADEFETPSGANLSLREAFRDAMTTPGADTIDFAPALNGAVITLMFGPAEIVVDDPGGVTVDASSLTNGLTIHGGPGTNRIFLVGLNIPAALTLRRLTLTGGNGESTAAPGSNGNGGAIYNHVNGTLTLERCTLTGNTATSNGGAILNGGTLNLTRCTLFGNIAGNGGAIHNFGATTTLTQCTLSDNDATSFGGAIANFATLNLTHCTIFGGHAANGAGGIQNAPGRTVTLDRSLIVGNTAGASPVPSDMENNGTVSLVGTSVIGASLGNPPAPGPGGNFIPDPPPFELAPLADNGGPTMTHALLPGSPAINAGNLSSITTDQRGFPIAGNPDVGAYEAQAGGRFTLGASSHAVFEGESITVTVQRTNGFIGPASVRLITVAGSANGTDYAERLNTTPPINFANGEIVKTVVISTKLDTIVEGTHSFTVKLVSPTPSPASTLGTPNTATVNIRDAIPVTNVNDSGPGSLRQALATAASRAGADLITFAPALSGKTIVLANFIPVQDVNGVTVDALNLPAGITVDGVGVTSSLFRLHPVSAVPSTLILRGLTLTGSADAAVANTSSTLVLARCTVTGNKTGGGGGGILSNGGSTDLSQCTISGNEAATNGGGILVMNNGSLILRQCTITRNTAIQQGGGVHIDGASGSLYINRSIIVGNIANAGNADVRRDGVPTSFDGANVINLNTVSPTPSGAPPLTDAFPHELGPLGSNGGPTKTHALLPESPALNTGDDSLFRTDQRGRPMVGDPDVGAYEAQEGGVFVVSIPTTQEEAAVFTTVANIIRTRDFLGTATVRFSATPGTATPADFTPITNELVTFPPGVTSMPARVLLKSDSLVEANESFNITLSSPSPGASLGTPSTSKVVIIDPSSRIPTAANGDAARPGVPIVSAPKPNAAINLDFGGIITVEGTATDNKGVFGVTASVNNGPEVALPLIHPGATTTKFSGQVGGAVTGVNTLKVTAYDFVTGQKQSTPVTTFGVLRPLLVRAEGNGSFTEGFAPKSYRVVGAPVTLTATPAPGYLLNQWMVSGLTTGDIESELGLDSVALEKPTITFIHREGLSLVAHFVPNPYISNYAWTYHGSIRFASAIGRSQLDTEGKITLTMLSTGAFSGSLKIDGLTLPFAGIFDWQGNARFGTRLDVSLHVPRPDKRSLTLTLNVSPPQGLPPYPVISGFLRQFHEGSVQASSNVVAGPAVHSAANPLPTSPFLTSTGGTATYTTFFRPVSGGPAVDEPTADRVPQGLGWGTFTLSRTGAVRLVGRLPDNTPFTYSTNVYSGGSWYMFVQLYPGLQGCILGLMGWPSIQDPTTDYKDTGDGQWICPLLDREHYPLGWPGGIKLEMRAAKYTVTGGASVVPITENPGTPGGNATLHITQGLLVDPLAKNVDISNTDVVTKIPSLDGDYSLSITRSTGMISGSFLHSDDTRPTFNGIIYQKVGGLAGAHGFFMTTTPKIKTYTGQVGNVYLDPQ